jgi:hypothetical protein
MVGILGLGTAKEKDKKTARTALEQAQQEPRGATGLVAKVVSPILDFGIDGRGPVASAQEVADQALAKSDGVEAAIDYVVRTHLAMGGTGGFFTGLGGFVTMPIALPVNVAEFYVVATRMTAAIAALRGYDIRRQNIRTAVLLALVGADAEDLLRKAGIPSPTGHLSDLVAQQLPGPALMVVNKGIAFRLVGTVGRSTFSRLGRALPFAGGAVSASVDTYMLKRIADHARREFPQVVAGQVTAS